MRKILILAILLIAGYFGYYYIQDTKPVVTIYPETGPIKIKPQNAGGLSLDRANSAVYDSLYPQKKAVTSSKLLPEPETPLNLISKEKIIDPIDNLIADLVQHGDDNSIIALPERNKTSLNIINIAPKNDNSEFVASKIDNKKDYKVQLASVKSETEAIKEGEYLKKKYAKILGNAVISYKKINYNEKQFFYLVLAGNYQTLSQAKNICKKLSGSQQTCMVVN